jgi:hypothetical protein
VDPVRRSRYVKLHPHVYFPQYEWSIWVDANLLINEPLDVLVDQVADAGRIGLYQHPHRDDAFAEAEEILRRGGLDDPAIVRHQVERYRQSGFEGGRLFETNVMVRAHNEVAIEQGMNAWWRELENGSRRDQVSLPLIIDKYRLDVVSLGPRGDSVRTSGLFTRFTHGPSPHPT